MTDIHPPDTTPKAPAPASEAPRARMNQDAINRAQEKLDALKLKLYGATREVREDVQKDAIADKAAYDLAHPPLERAKLALAANDAEIERLRAEGVSETVLDAMAVDSAQLREQIANAPTPMAPEAIAEIARRTAEIDIAVFEAALAAGVETDNRVVINQWCEANPERRAEIFTPEIVAMMVSLGEYRREVTPAPKQTTVKPAMRRVQGPIDPKTNEHTYTIEVATEPPMARIGNFRQRYIQALQGVDNYVDDYAEMLMADEEDEAKPAAPKQMRIEP